MPETQLAQKPMPPARNRCRPSASPTRQSRLGLLAFVQLHQDQYLLYARTRLDENVARSAVAAALDTVSRQWDRYLQCAQPAADAWRQLSIEISARSHGANGSAPAATRLHSFLPHNTADAAILHWRLRLTPDVIADLMGVDPPTVAALLLTAKRNLPTIALEQLEQHTPLP